MAVPTDWECLGEGAAHAVELERVQTLRDSGTSFVALERCRRCGLLYHCRGFEVSDWSESGDYYDETRIWTPLEPGEEAAACADPAYEPSSKRSHRWDSGWRAG